MNFSSYDIWLNEKFDEESDPIRDMRIGGLPKFWAKMVLKLGSHNTNSFRKEFKIPEITYSRLQIDEAWVIWKILIRANNWVPPQEAFESVFYFYDNYYKDISFDKRFIADFLKKHFQMDVNPDYEVKHNIDEAFTEESDPIQDLDIGIINKLNKLKQKLTNLYTGWKPRIDSKNLLIVIEDYWEESAEWKFPLDYRDQYQIGDDFIIKIKIIIDIISEKITWRVIVKNEDIPGWKFRGYFHENINNIENITKQILDIYERDYPTDDYTQDALVFLKRKFGTY